MKIWKLVIVVLAVGMFSVSAVAQDECINAVAPGTSLDLCTMTANVTDPFPSCGSGSGTLTMWYTFTANETSARLRTDLNSAGTDSTFGVYSGTCGTLTEIGCSEDEVGYNGDICVDGLTVSDTYYVMVMSWNDGACGFYQLDKESEPGRICGDNILAMCGGEECDGTDDDACPGECLPDCTCPLPTPALPIWGIVGLGVLLVGGGATAVARRRKKA